MGKKLSELVETTAVIGTDIFHLRTIGGIDKKITGVNLLLADGLLDTYFKGQGIGIKPIYEKLTLRDTGVKLGNNIRSTIGDQVIEGVGFLSAVIIIIAADGDSLEANMSIGISTSIDQDVIAIAKDGTGSYFNNGKCVFIQKDVSNFIIGVISTVSNDGFTITWTLTGARSVKFAYLCLP